MRLPLDSSRLRHRCGVPKHGTQPMSDVPSRRTPCSDVMQIARAAKVPAYASRTLSVAAAIVVPMKSAAFRNQHIIGPPVMLYRGYSALFHLVLGRPCKIDSESNGNGEG
jgi:hypothetical protein